MAPGVPVNVTMTLVLTAMDIRRAERPFLPDAGDYDVDLVPNGADNCVLIDNPDQLDFNDDGFGDACSLPDVNGDPTIPDRDGDRVADGIDNCVWIVNPDQVDSTPSGGIGEGPDGIGEECEQLAPVNIMTPDGTLMLGPLVVTVEGGSQTFVSANFPDLGSAPAVNCDPGFTSCDLVDGAVFLSSP
jgi:hypothetical protein